MIRVEQDVDAPVDVVQSVLDDGWSYVSWVVGASRIRAVDAAWPAPGSRLHHSAGAWPLVLDDTTTVVRRDPGRELVLQARGWPAGEARIRLLLSPLSGDRTRVVLEEDATSGPGRLVPAPLRHLVLHPRNRESLQRLALLCAGRAGRPARGEED
ncbi:SRPBCC family protein [Vallicoccus soli]|uniref:SRPBCC family protein n=1 Tax=Vallicoccus soli TaxID=2339232 RepID=A0A3A3YR09_9ACTN|nr:SRPBCC family protein [Vallicoccus soli]RJK93806.1 SRPBCC family protein [Vallicoccus soli]